MLGGNRAHRGHRERLLPLLLMCPTLLESLLPGPPQVGGVRCPPRCWPTPSARACCRSAGRRPAVPVMGFDGAAGGGVPAGRPDVARGRVRRMKRVDGKLAVLDPLRWGAARRQGRPALESTEADCALLPVPQDDDRRGEFSEVLKVQFQVERLRAGQAGQTRCALTQPPGHDSLAPSTPASPDDGDVAGGRPAAEGCMEETLTHRAGRHGDRNVEQNRAPELAGAKLVERVAGIDRLLANSVLPEGDVYRMANGELQPRALWRSGPGVLMNEWWSAMVLLGVILQHAIRLTCLVLGITLRTVAHMLAWALAVGDAKEWWIPQMAEYASSLQSRTQDAWRTHSLVRLARYKLATALVWLCDAVTAVVTPEVVARITSWAADLGHALSTQAQAWSSTLQEAIQASSLPDDGEPPAVVVNSSLLAAPTKRGPQQSSSSAFYDEEFERVRASHTARLEQDFSDVLAVNVAGVGTGNATTTQERGNVKPGVQDDPEAARPGDTDWHMAGRTRTNQTDEQASARLGAVRAGTRTRKRDVIANVTSSVGDSVGKSLLTAQGLSKTVVLDSVSKVREWNLSAAFNESYAWTVDALTRGLAHVNVGHIGSSTQDLSQNASAQDGVPSFVSDANAWLGSVLSGRNADVSRLVQVSSRSHLSASLFP